MQETEFIKQNQGKWNDFESELYSDNRDPEKLLDLFIQTTDDLSYSRTHYPHRSVRYYLNGVARQVHAQIYKNRRAKNNAFGQFWQLDLPQALYHGRRQLTLSFGIMLLGLVIGIISSIYYQGFPAVILSEHYIETTEQLIADGNPMGIYGLDKDPLHMFLSIAWNNIQYAFGAFAFGILFGIGTVYALLSTGIMVGAFAQFFIAKGLFKQFFLAVMLHGTLELGMITIAGGAGLMMAKAVMFPESYLRIESIVVAARASIKIMIATSIFLLYAALIEGFLTRHTDASDWARLSLIVLSAAILLGYFVYYPWYLNRKGLLNKDLIEDLPELEKPVIDFQIVKSAGEMITESFYIFFKKASKVIHQTWIWSAVAVIAAGFILKGKWSNLPFHYEHTIGREWFWPWMAYRPFYDIDSSIWIVLAMTAVLSGALFFVAQKIPLLFELNERQKNATLFISCASIALLWMTILQLPSFFRVLLISAAIPYGMLVIVISAMEAVSILTAMWRAGRLIFVQFGVWILLVLTFLAFHWMILIFMQSVMFEYVVKFIVLNVPVTLGWAEQVPYLLYLFFLGGAIVFMLAITGAGALLYYYSSLEVSTASNLMNRIRKVGKHRKLFGLDRDDEQ